MSKRFEYDRMTARDFRDALASIDMPPLAFGRIFGFDEGRIKDWANGRQDIPVWCFAVLRILQNCPGAIPEARQAAAEIIRIDNARPQDGEYPYLLPEDDGHEN